MSERKIDDKTGGSKKGFTQKIKALPSGKNSKTIIIIMLILGVSVIGIPLLVNVITGSFFGLPPIDDEALHIGYCKFTLYARNSTGFYNQVNGSFEFIDYYNDSRIIKTGIFDNQTVYQTTNVTIGYITWVNSSDGLLYPNSTFLIYCNSSFNTPTNNEIYINSYATPSELDASIFKLDDDYGSFGLGDLTSENFTIEMKLTNTGNGSVGKLGYIPSCHRFNETIWNTGLWLKINVLVDFIQMGTNSQDIYYDGIGNSYFMLPSVNYMNHQEIELTFQCQSIPTQFDIIEGQWNGTVLEVMV